MVADGNGEMHLYIHLLLPQVGGACHAVGGACHAMGGACHAVGGAGLFYPERAEALRAPGLREGATPGTQVSGLSFANC